MDKDTARQITEAVNYVRSLEPIKLFVGGWGVPSIGHIMTARDIAYMDAALLKDKLVKAKLDEVLERM